MTDPAANTADALLSVRSLSVHHGQFKALHDVDLFVRPDEVVSLIGANGAGKSSLMQAIVGQASKIAGSVIFQGSSLVGRTTADIVASGIALMPEGRRLFPSLTVEENLNIGWEVGRKGDVGLDDVYGYFPAVYEKRNSRARDLSGGQQQMVAFGRALLGNPSLLLCDEMSLGLSPKIVKEMYDVIATIRSRGVSILLVEQDVARSLATSDRYYCLLEGRVTLTGASATASRDVIMEHYFGV